ncbi:MAG: TSUP family transporter [Propioniciclava sp.]|uniref:sulfite exporter TauE/SafE family protein n=1 Tax=Propioniciclava sp. TaxID=2038686 RepID=UPI0039E4769F
MTGLELPLLTIVLLVAASFLAGWVDSIVGGGGLIQLPALLIGMPADAPVPTIAGTNKVPSAMGTSVAAVTYLRRVRIPWAALIPLVGFSALGSSLGAQLTHFLDRAAFTPLVLAAIVGVGWYTWRRPQLGLHHQVRHTGWRAFGWLSLIGLMVGMWDGFIGPGTGSFFLILIVAVMGFEFLVATALAKVANLTTNLAAIAVFGLSGNIWWGLGLVMGVANLLGGLIGATMALRHGNGFVRKVFLVVIVALGLRLSWDMLAPVIGF